MLCFQRSSVQRILYHRSRSHSSSSKNGPKTQTIATNVDTPMNDRMHFKHALNKIPRRILYQLLKKNSLNIPNRRNENFKYTPSKKLLLSKLYRLTTKHLKVDTSKSKASRLELSNFAMFSSDLVRKSCLKLRDFNNYFNCNHEAMTNANHPFLATLSVLMSDLNKLNLHIYEHQTSSSNPCIETDSSLHDIKRDFIFELLPSMHQHKSCENMGNIKDKADADMLKLCQIFIKFMNFPRLSMLDHIQYISHLCHLNHTLDSFLNIHQKQSVHPSRNTNRGYYDYDDGEYDSEEYDDEEDEFEEEAEYCEDNEMPSIQIQDEHGKSVPFEVESVKQRNNRNKHKSAHHRTLEKIETKMTPKSLPMNENKLNELYMTRLKNIYKMDFNQYGVHGLDENIKTQLKRALLSRGLHPSLITTSDNANAQESSSKISIEHNKGILLHGPPGTGKTLLAKTLKHLLITNDDNVHIVNGPEIEDVYIGQTEKNIRNLFEAAKADYRQYGMHSPLHIIIFDEIDSIAKKRDSSSQSKIYDRSVQQLLSCLDGAHTLNNVLTIGTTNRFQDIDNALLRPGRFGVHIFVALPDENQRYELLTKCNNIQSVLDQSKDVDLKWLINLTEGLSHSDIVALLTQSKINAMERLIGDFFEDDTEKSEEKDLYQNIQNDFKITSRDIVCALDEIRINQVYRERNGRSMNDNYAGYDVLF